MLRLTSCVSRRGAQLVRKPPQPQRGGGAGVSPGSCPGERWGRVPGLCGSMRSQKSSRSGAGPSRRCTNGVAVHGHVMRSRPRMWKRWSASRTCGSSDRRTGRGKKPSAFAVVMASHGTGLLSPTTMGAALDSESMRWAHARPICRTVLDHKRGCSCATVRQWRQTWATAGTHPRGVP